MFASWGSVTYRHRFAMLVIVMFGVLGLGAWGLGVFGEISQGGYEAPRSEADKAGRLVTNRLAEQETDIVVIYRMPDGTSVDDAELGRDIRTTLDELPDDAVTQVISYWHVRTPQLVNKDHTLGLATVTLTGADINAKVESYERIEGAFAVPNVHTDVAGEIPVQLAMAEHSERDLVRAEAVSLPVVLVLLVLIFGGLVAAALPVLVGGLAVFGSLGLLRGITLFTDVNAFSVNVASMLGLGLAIDYGLFIVGRFREERAAGYATGDAVRRTVASAGRTVAFSSTLLVIALAGLMLFPQSFLKSLAYGGISAVSLAALISLTVLPALLGILGRGVDWLSMPWRKRNRRPDGSRWYRFAHRVMRRPLVTAAPLLALLALLGAPFLNVQFGTPDERMLPAEDESRQAVETLYEEFPAMSGTGVQVVLEGNPAPGDISWYIPAIESLPGINDVALSQQANGVRLYTAELDGDPYGPQANKAVDLIRALPQPDGSEVLVGGPTALNVDSMQATAEQLPLVVGVLVLATLVLMFLAFGSVLLPIKAVVLSMLSLSATFGVLTWVFVDGHGADLIGVTPAPMEIGIVVLMASVVFGLSTDYEVFLLSRMVEARSHGASTEEAVATGLARTGRMISAAALLLVVVTGAFGFSGLSMMRFIGLGMIFALVLDATVVRMILVPAILKLLGDVVWTAPGPLKRLQQRAGVQEAEPVAETEAEPVTPEFHRELMRAR